MMTIEKVMNKNNKGVELLHSGRCKLAIEAFREALRQLRDFFQKDSAFASHFSLIIETQLIPSMPNSNYIYHSALVANLAKEKPNTKLRNYHKTSFHPVEVILYNLSLAHHLNINGSPVRSKKEYKRVLAIYERALAAFHVKSANLKIPIMIEKYPLRDIVCLGILNNIGVLNYELKSYRPAALCFNILKTLINRSILSDLGEEAHNGMLINAWLLEEPKLAQAA